MYRLCSRLIIYRNAADDEILSGLAKACRDFDGGHYDKEELTGRILDQIHRLLDLATTYGFNNNLWHCYLAYLLAMTETPFTLVSEKVGANEGSVNIFAKQDLAIFKQLFDYDFSRLEEGLDINYFTVISHYQAVVKEERVYNRSVSEKVLSLSEAIENAQSVDALYSAVTDFYFRYGVGMFGLNKAFRVSENPKKKLLIPVTNTLEVSLDDLIGYENEKKKLVDNTEAFVRRREANNVLLYGEAGTGKSTSVKAILNQYYGEGLRMIEVYKHQFHYLSRIISQIKNRNYRFIIYMDDLSFEETETEYKYLKAIIEGGLEPKPENVLIYATSNRRHLVRETWKDKKDLSDEDIHQNDTIQEKLSLANRFGIQIGFFKPGKMEFNQIVEGLASRYPQIRMSREELLMQANKWELTHGGYSGRTAQQFVSYLAGRAEAEA